MFLITIADEKKRKLKENYDCNSENSITVSDDMSLEKVRIKFKLMNEVLKCLHLGLNVFSNFVHISIRV